MKKRAFFVYLSVAILLLSLLVFVSSGLSRLHKKSNFFKDLKVIASEEFKGANIDYSFLIKKLGFFGWQLTYQENEKIPAASLIKLPILAAAFYALDEKKISLEDMVTVKKGDVTGGSGKLKALSLPKKLFFRELLELMVSASDNTAANKVIQILGFDYINTVFKKLGLSETVLFRNMMDFSLRRKGVENYTSASDVSGILEKIYRLKLIDRKLSKLALSFLKNQKVNDRLPRYLPSDTIVAHKTGLERGVVHDAGIVFSPKADYLICVLVRGGSYPQAKKFIARLSLLTYNLYNK